MLSRGDRIAERGIHDHDTGGGSRWNIDIVDTDTGAANHLKVLGLGDDVLVGLGGRTDGEAIILVNDLEQLILGQAGNDIGLNAARFENLDGGGRQLVSNKNARGHDFISEGRMKGIGPRPASAHCALRQVGARP